jgi:putative ABC transport system substrate-binding protein
MMGRRGFVSALVGGILAAPLAGQAQAPGTVYRIGLLGTHSPSAHEKSVDALRAGLRDLEYVEGKNIVIEYRWAAGKIERLTDSAAELVALRVDVIVTTGGTPAALAAKRATTTIPIVITGVGDAVGTGLVASLSRPGGNITGLTDSVPELVAKRLELLKEALPRAGRVAVLVNPDSPLPTSRRPEWSSLENAAKSLKIELQKVEVRSPDELERAFSTMGKSADAVVVTQDALFNANVSVIATLAMKTRLPSSGTRDFAEAGGVVGYGMDFADNNRRAARFVDKILKGLKTARSLGLSLPPTLLLRANHVIE